MSAQLNRKPYRGRLAPSPTGLLHVGHAHTFWLAAERAGVRLGTLILRNEDLDPQRCRPEFAQAMIEDLRWLGISWSEGPDCGGPFGPYVQSERRPWYFEAWKTLAERGMIYPCTCSRKDVAQAAGAPNDGDDEPMYSGKCRPDGGSSRDAGSVRENYVRDHASEHSHFSQNRREVGHPTFVKTLEFPAGVNWRFHVPDGEEISFTDLHLGPQRMVAGRDFGDFIVWRRDDVPAYQLAVVVDDAAMDITEVVRGADLLKSTARQILLFRALGLATPGYFHCDLVRDGSGVRLAKRHDSLSICRLRELGFTAEQVRAGEVGDLSG